MISLWDRPQEEGPVPVPDLTPRAYGVVRGGVEAQRPIQTTAVGVVRELGSVRGGGPAGYEQVRARLGAVGGEEGGEEGAEEEEEEDTKAKTETEKKAEEEDEEMQKMIFSCGKLVLVDKLLPKLKSQGRRVLIFSQMVRVQDILEDYLDYRGYTYERLDGTMRSVDRQAGIDRFSMEGSTTFVFLLCTRARGVGTNRVWAERRRT
mmetsp:Transcript_14619/g.35645  ORF Transcript_14619/g.35645 Transcript_14619/m.35645 type:complete len:206 (-) Transcript_14619:1016-1633(-)